MNLKCDLQGSKSERKEKNKKRRETHIPSHVPQIWTLEDHNLSACLMHFNDFVESWGPHLASPGALGTPVQNKVTLLGDCGRHFFAKGRPREPADANNHQKGPQSDPNGIPNMQRIVLGAVLLLQSKPLLSESTFSQI